MPHNVESFKRQIEEFTGSLIDPYVERLAATNYAPHAKEINDSVWRTVILQGFEVLILDSPLLQRLRYVRQLGVAHWVYPAATHSRLEHSIGALHQIQRVIAALNSSVERPQIEEDFVNLLRLAALCHDVGHGVMSHVSENAFKELESVETLRLEMLDHFEKEKIQLGEAAAYFMVGSPSFRKLLEIAQKKTRHKLPLSAPDLVQNAILGRRIHDRIPLLQELISGPFDIDKLDYMTRDAYMAGIPVVTDIDRLVRKMRLVEVSNAKLPREIAKDVTDEHASYFIQAIALSGARTLDELMIGRALLFDKIYRHQKVRACEAMVSHVLLAIAKLCDEERRPLLPLMLADEELLRCERSVIERVVGRALTDTEWAQMETERDIAQRLRNRETFVRAYAYAHKLPGDPFANDPEQKQGLEALRRENGQLRARHGMLVAMCSLLCDMRARGVAFAKNISDGSLSRYLALDNPPQQSDAGEIARAYLAVHGNTLMRFRDDSAETSPWSNAYALTRDLGFVFAARELAPAAFLAAEAFVRMKYGIRTPPSAHIYSKVDSDAIVNLRKQLTTAGFYDDKAPDLRAPVLRLIRADVPTRIDNIVLRMGEFQGLVTDDEEVRAVRVTKERVYAWLQQFRSDDDVEGALAMLESIRMVSRADVHQAVRNLFVNQPEFQKAIFCPLGSPKDSSNILTYFVNDLKPEYPDVRLETLPEALAQKTEAPNVFLDDFLSTGNQAITIVLQWLDKADDTPLEEAHVLPLNRGAREAFLTKRIGFVFAAGTTAGKSSLETTLAKEGLNFYVHVHLDAALPQAFGAGTPVAYRGAAQRDKFMATCKNIGAQVLSGYGGKPRDMTWISGKELGYGNFAYLLIFPYNVPTASLTALWCGGKVDGFTWLPLVPRRAKL